MGVKRGDNRVLLAGFSGGKSMLQERIKLTDDDDFVLVVTKAEAERFGLKEGDRAMGAIITIAKKLPTKADRFKVWPSKKKG